MSNNYSVLGKNVVKVDAVEKVLGTAKFAGDYFMPDMLYGGVFRSTVPHAKIKKLNLEKARALPGVHAVLDYTAIPGKNRFGIIVKDEPCLVDDKVRRYGDAIAVWACLDESSTGQGGAAVADSPMRQRFDGTALFREGRFVMGLSAARTRLFNLIRGHGDAFGYAWRDDTIELVPEAAAVRRIGWNGDAVSLALSVRLRAPDGFDEADTEALEAALRADMIDLIQACQRLGCEPFGFSEATAAHFATVPQWIAFDWRAHYRRAPVDVDIKLTSVNK